MKTRRGGSRTLGRALSTNRSGLAAIWFGYEGAGLRVYVAAGSRRTSYSVEANGLQGAVEKAVDVRRGAGLPVHAVSTVLQRLRAWRRENERSARS